VPLSVAREWLLRIATADIADVEGRRTVIEQEAKKGASRPALCWRGLDESQLVDAGDVRAGDTLVVPSSYGGADEFGWRGWHSGEQIPVKDVGDVCFNRMADAGPRDGPKRPIRLRLHPAIFAQWVTGEDREARMDRFERALHQACGVFKSDEDGDIHESLHQLLTDYREVAGGENLLVSTIEHFLEDERAKVVMYPGGFLLHGKVRPGFSGSQDPLPAEVSDLADVTTEDDTASVLSRRVSLKDHSAGVVTWVRRFTNSCDERLARLFERAAELHDLGKGDARFQTMLYGGDVIEAAAGELLAKSGMDREDAEVFQRAWRLSGLPPHFRHEFVSVALIRGHRDDLLRELPEADRELLEYLVGTHHGRGRPFAPIVHEAHPETVVMDWNGVRLSASPDHRLWRAGSGWTDLFWRLVRRFGYWGLAYLEATLVLADQACSREEEQAS
jgi:CRISPR-associated endonuclease/helicase Cas3